MLHVAPVDKNNTSFHLRVKKKTEREKEQRQFHFSAETKTTRAVHHLYTQKQGGRPRRRHSQQWDCAHVTDVTRPTDVPSVDTVRRLR